jgi:hypothetical protein
VDLIPNLQLEVEVIVEEGAAPEAGCDEIVVLGGERLDFG